MSEKLGKIRSYRTVSALKVEIPTENLDWRIDLISSVVYWIIFVIEALSSDALSLNMSCSPFMNVPVVCESVISFVPVEFAW